MRQSFRLSSRDGPKSMLALAQVSILKSGKRYLVIDLKVLVRSFNCESRACYVGNPRESFSSILRK